MPRSPLTETYEKVNDIFQTINALEPDQRNLLLDWLFPEPEPAKKPQKKSSKRAAGGGRGSSKSARASGMARTLNDNLSQRRQEMIPDVVKHDTGEPDRCQFTRADGNLCKLLPDHNIHHLTTAREFHYFQSLPAPRCAFRVTDIERCSATEDDPIHDKDANPATYHDFVPPASSAAGASGGD